MRLVGPILLVAAAATAVSEVLILRAVRPPDGTSALLGGLWIAMPYFAVAGLALLLRRRPAALVALLIALLLVAPVGVSLFNATANQQEVARQQVRDAVGPGEDPDHGPAGMRRAGAETGAAVGSVFSILLAVVVPPVQLAVVAVAAGIGFGVSAWARGRQTAPKGDAITPP